MADVCKFIGQSSAATSDNLGRNIIATSEDKMFQSETRMKSLEAQKKLLPILVPSTLKLCGILQLSDDGKSLVQELLEYVISNHIINKEVKEPIMLQAFQISLCWTAASFLKQNLSHKKSLACAKKHLNFNCSKNVVDYMYAMVNCLKSRLSKVSHFFQKETSEVGSSSVDPGVASEKDVLESVTQVRKKFREKMKKVEHKLWKEENEILRIHKEETEDLKFKHKIESDVIQMCTRTGKNKDNMWEVEQQKQEYDHKQQLATLLERLKKQKQEAVSKLHKSENIWVEGLQKWAYNESLCRPSLDASNSARSTTREVMRLSQTAQHVTDKTVVCNGGHISAVSNAEVSLEVAENVSLVDPSSLEQNLDPEGLHGVVSEYRDLCNAVSEITPSVDEEVHVTTLATMQDKEAETGPDDVMLDSDGSNLVALDLDLPQLSKSATGNENTEVHETINSRNDFDESVPVIPLSSEEQNPVVSVATVQEKVAEAEAGAVDEDFHADQISVSASVMQNIEAQGLASNSATQLNQQSLLDSAVDGNTYQEMLSESSPTADRDTHILASSSVAQDGEARACLNQNIGQPIEIPFQEETEIQPRNEESICCEIFQTEGERLKRKNEENLKSHEDKKLRLISDFAKDIEDVKAKIRQEYVTELRLTEEKFILEKEELLGAQSKVISQTLLASAWKFIVMAPTCSSSFRVHHDENYTADQLLARLYVQRNAHMPSLEPGSSSANSPAARQQTTPLAHTTIPQYYTAPLRPTVDYSPTHPVYSLEFLTSIASNPHIASFSSLRPQGGVEFQAPLHYQPCGSSMPFTRGANAFSYEERSRNHQTQNDSLSSPMEHDLPQQVTPTQASVPYITHNTDTNPVYQQRGVISNQERNTTSAPSTPSLPHTAQRQFVPPNTMVHNHETAEGSQALRTVSALELLTERRYPSSTWSSTEKSARHGLPGVATEIVSLSDDE